METIQFNSGNELNRNTYTKGEKQSDIIYKLNKIYDSGLIKDIVNSFNDFETSIIYALLFTYRFTDKQRIYSTRIYNSRLANILNDSYKDFEFKTSKQVSAITAIVYKYTFPDGKVYIGETINEDKRRECFYRCDYSGEKINKHIIKYKGKADYQVLHKEWFISKTDAKQWSQQKEREEILKHNSHIDGLNSNKGFLSKDVIQNRIFAYNALPIEIRKQILLLDNLDTDIKKGILLN